MTSTVPPDREGRILGRGQPPAPGRRRRWPVPQSLLIGLAPTLLFVVISVIRSRPGDNYSAVGLTTDSVIRSLVVPESIAAGALIIIVSGLGWWRHVAVDPRRGGPAWATIAPGLIIVLCLGRLALVNWGGAESLYFLWLVLGTLLVGVFEELLTRGMLLVGLRRRLPEIWVWALSSGIFGLLHLINILAGAGVGATIIQVVFAGSFGSTLYLARRLSGTIAVPIVMHGLWDFVTMAALGSISGDAYPGLRLIGTGLLGLASFVVLAFGVVAGVFVALRDDRPARLCRRWRTVPARVSGVRLEVSVAGRWADWDHVPRVRSLR